MCLFCVSIFGLMGKEESYFTYTKHRSYDEMNEMLTMIRFEKTTVPRSRSKVLMTRKQSWPNLSRATWYRKSGYSPRHSRSSASGRKLSSWKSSRSKPGGGEAREPPAHPAPEPAQPSAVTRPSRDHRPARPSPLNLSLQIPPTQTLCHYYMNFNSCAQFIH